jgi:Superinfection immunity protein
MMAVTSGNAAIAVGSIVLGGLFLYLLPTVIGVSRKVVNIGSVFAINLLLGWSLIGWVVALSLALRTNPPYAYPGHRQAQTYLIADVTKTSGVAHEQAGAAVQPTGGGAKHLDKGVEIVQPGDMRHFDDGWARFDSSGRWIYTADDKEPA